jgi:hypothetical protein
MKKWIIAAVLILAANQGAQAVITPVSSALFKGVIPTVPFTLSETYDASGIPAGGSIIHPENPFCSQVFYAAALVDSATKAIVCPVTKSVQTGTVGQRIARMAEIYDLGDVPYYCMIYYKTDTAITMKKLYIEPGIMAGPFRVRGDIVAVKIFSSTVWPCIVNFY